VVTSWSLSKRETKRRTKRYEKYESALHRQLPEGQPKKARALSWHELRHRHKLAEEKRRASAAARCAQPAEKG